MILCKTWELNGSGSREVGVDWHGGDASCGNVEKLWKSLWGKLWDCGGKVVWKSSEGVELCGKGGFSTEFLGVNTRRFEQDFYADLHLLGGEFSTIST